MHLYSFTRKEGKDPKIWFEIEGFSIAVITKVPSQWKSAPSPKYFQRTSRNYKLDQYDLWMEKLSLCRGCGTQNCIQIKLLLLAEEHMELRLSENEDRFWSGFHCENYPPKSFQHQQVYQNVVGNLAREICRNLCNPQSLFKMIIFKDIFSGKRTVLQ